jgi:hypothetical protein
MRKNIRQVAKMAPGEVGVIDWKRIVSSGVK